MYVAGDVGDRGSGTEGYTVGGVFWLQGGPMVPAGGDAITQMQMWYVCVKLCHLGSGVKFAEKNKFLFCVFITF